MQWDDSPGAGFTSGKPWLTVNPNHRQVNAAQQVGVPGSVFEHYRRLIALRHQEPAVAHGDFTLLLPDHDQLFAFTRRHESTELVVVANFSGQQGVVPATLLDRCTGAELVVGDRDGADLLPWESRVYRRLVGAVELPVR
jgi:oligo-1,6-glucosidase